MSEYEADHVHLSGYTRFKLRGHDTPITLPPDGVLEIDEEVLASQGAAFCIAGGESLRGVRIVPSGGGAMAEEWNDDDLIMLIFVAEDGGTVFVINEDVSVTEPTERISVNDGSDTVLVNMQVQAFSMYIPSLGERRWRFNDWLNVP